MAAAKTPEKHPLEHKWTIWYDSRKTIVGTDNWEENLQKVWTKEPRCPSQAR